MAYLDMWAVRTEPQWWTGALYQRAASGAYVFRGYTKPQRVKWADFHNYQMGTYSLASGWRVYPFYWDSLAGVWMRREGKPAVAGDDKQLPAGGFDATGGTQRPGPSHDAAAPFGETSLSTAGKLVAGALAGGAAWYLYNYGWPFAKPRTNKRK